MPNLGKYVLWFTVTGILLELAFFGFGRLIDYNINSLLILVIAPGVASKKFANDHQRAPTRRENNRLSILSLLAVLAVYAVWLPVLFYIIMPEAREPVIQAINTMGMKPAIFIGASSTILSFLLIRLGYGFMGKQLAKLQEQNK